MKLDDIVELLSGVPLFSGLSDKQLTSIALSGEPVVFQDGREIISEDKSGDAAFLILSGDVVRTAGLYAKQDGQSYGPGTFVGELAMLIDNTYGSTVTAVTKVRAMKFHRSAMRELLEEDVRLAEHFSEKITARFVTFVGALRDFREQLDESNGTLAS